ncbi:GNAT family N-acetyltransferase [Nonomuraea sp. NPDC003201]
MKITVVTPADLGASEIAAWRILQKGSPELANPFLCPEFTLAVGRHREQARVAIIEDGDRITGFFPFERHGLGTGKPIGAGLTDAQGAILAPETDIDVPSLLKACGLNVWEFDHLVAGQFPGHHASRHPSPIIDLRGGLDTYLETIKKNSGKTYKSTAYKERKLGRDTGEIRHDYAVTDPAALRTLLTWKSDQYRRTGRTDRFARPWITRLVHDLLQTDTPAFAGVLDILYAGDKPVAAHFGLRSDTVLAGWFPAYDTTYARYSPGLIQHLAMTRAAADHGILLIDMGRGDKEYKDKLKNGELEVAEGRLARATPAAGVHWLIRTPVREARNTVLSHPWLLRPADRFLKACGALQTAWRGKA